MPAPHLGVCCASQLNANELGWARYPLRPEVSLVPKAVAHRASKPDARWLAAALRLQRANDRCCRRRPLIVSLGESLLRHSQLPINEFAEQNRQDILIRQSARSAITMMVLCPPIVTRSW